MSMLNKIVAEVCPDHIHNWSFAKLMPRAPLDPETSMFVCVCGGSMLVQHVHLHNTVKKNLRNAGEISEDNL